MYEVYQLWLEIRGQPLRWGSIAAVLLFLLDRFGRKLITSQVKRLFHSPEDDFQAYSERQIRIEEKIDALLQKEGITWPANTLSINSTDTARRNAGLSSLLWVILSPARIARRYILLRRVNMNKPINFASLTVALLGAIKLVLAAFGIEMINDEQINAIANGVAAVAAVVGVLMTHRKKGDDLDAHIRAASESAE